MPKQANTLHLRHKDCTYPNPFFGHPACNVTGIGNPNYRRARVTNNKQKVGCGNCKRMKHGK